MKMANKKMTAPPAKSELSSYPLVHMTFCVHCAIFIS